METKQRKSEKRIQKYVDGMETMLNVCGLEYHSIWSLDENRYCFPPFEYLFHEFQTGVKLPFMGCFQYLAWNDFVPFGMNLNG